MFTNFTPQEKSVHYPEDRRLIFGLKPKVLRITAVILFMIISLAWAQYLIYGLPEDPSLKLPPIESVAVKGFPTWVIICHWINFFFLVILIRSGLSILMDHPRLYWNNGCKPESEWLKFTPLKVPLDKWWTAKDDARYISPVWALPGYRHTVGIARGWHFIHVPFFVTNGIIFVSMLFLTDHWKRLVPTDWHILSDSWSVFVHYITFHLPVEPNGFYNYNALQKLSYFGMVFVLAPLAMLSGMCMSPALENRFHWLPKIFGNRQGARSVHFLVMLAYIVFIVIHVCMVIISGFVRNMNHITLGTDSADDKTGMYIGLSIILLIIAFLFLAHYISWKKPRWIQNSGALINGTLWELTINKLKPKAYYTKKDISPYFWVNGKLPTDENWVALSKNDFKDFKLQIGGLVSNPIELSLAELKSIGKEQHITMHHCIQGWSGVAEWGGLSLSALIDLVKPHPNAKIAVFYSFGEGLYGGVYYDTHTVDNCRKPSSVLAWEMNYEPLPLAYGAPLRLRIENQLGYKQVKWIARIEFVESFAQIGKGYGSKNADDEYFDLLANT
ncbi:molybdopterin-dependent oxidoreductase [Pedobacter sp. GSP4]|uniref:molybdopterin-dependent oxidoreductase n=1 Tax=Pedobacter sp. GSP4 TaxID=3453716 RepID=UPI003EEB642F